MSKEKRYDNLYNEGAEGYNPHRRGGKESGEPRWSILSGKRSRIMRIMEGTSIHDSRYAELEAELAAVEAEIKADKAGSQTEVANA